LDEFARMQPDGRMVFFGTTSLLMDREQPFLGDGPLEDPVFGRQAPAEMNLGMAAPRN
jgi:hypothetical protein